jgi:hypothetical protein
MSEPVELNRPDVLTDLGQETLRRLIRVWFDFERRLAKVPIIRRLDLGQFNLEDYQNLLLNMRPQVVEGARWIARCASSFDRDHADVRSVIIGHSIATMPMCVPSSSVTRRTNTETTRSSKRTT